VLGWNPTVDESTRLTDAQLTQIDHDLVAGGAARGSLAGARRFVATLNADVAAASTTTKTAPPRPKPKPVPKRKLRSVTKPSRPTVTTAR